MSREDKMNREELLMWLEKNGFERTGDTPRRYTHPNYSATYGVYVRGRQGDASLVFGGPGNNNLDGSYRELLARSGLEPNAWNSGNPGFRGERLRNFLVWFETQG